MAPGPRCSAPTPYGNYALVPTVPALHRRHRRIRVPFPFQSRPLCRCPGRVVVSRFGSRMLFENRSWNKSCESKPDPCAHNGSPARAEPLSLGFQKHRAPLPHFPQPNIPPPPSI